MTVVIDTVLLAILALALLVGGYAYVGNRNLKKPGYPLPPV